MRIMRMAVWPLAVLGLLSIAAETHLRNGMRPLEPQRLVLQIDDRLALAFEANEGQAGAGIDFVARGRGYALLLAPTEVALSIPGDDRTAGLAGAALRMKLVGADARPSHLSLDELPAEANYFLGNDAAKWRRHIATYTKVGYRNVYPGVDLVYYGDHRRLEFDFVVKPAIDPSGIALEFEGADRIAVNSQGDLVLQIAGHPILQLHKPILYQDIDGTRRDIAGGYVLDGRRVRFQIARYDMARPLVIDPVLAFATRLGGSGDDAAYAIAVDGAGNIYVTGDTTSTDLPRTGRVGSPRGGAGDAFVAKLSADGARLVYITYLGGSGADVGFGIAVDAAGNAYVTGDTRSSDFPVVKPLQARLAGASDIFVSKLSADGAQLIYSSYIGGSGGERGLGIGVDAAGNASVTGYTNSTDFPTANALQPAFAGGNADAFALKLNASGSAFVYSTYLGGGNDRPDIGTALAVDPAGNAYLTGMTNSPDFPVAKPLQPFVGPTDVYVTKLDPAGALVYSTHLGGKADDEGMGIAVDAAGSAYVTGHTESPDFPTTAGAFRKQCVAIDAKLPVGDICLGGDVFVSKLSPDGSALIYSTYLNGNRFEVARAIAVDAKGSAYVTGLTNSTDFPAIDAIQPKFGGGAHDAFVVKLDPGGAVTYSTYLGGSGEDGGYGIAVDPAGDAWVAGHTMSPDFPLRRPLQNSPRTPRGTRDAFIAKISEKPAAHH